MPWESSRRSSSDRRPRHLTKGIDRWNSVTRGERDELFALAEQKRIDVDKQRARLSVQQRRRMRFRSLARCWPATPQGGAPAHPLPPADLWCLGAALGLLGLTNSASTASFGTASLTSSSRLAPSTFMKLLMPVTLPPGRLRLATRPALTGSSPTTKTIGIVPVAAFAAKAPGKVWVAMTAGLRPTRSAARRAAGRTDRAPSDIRGPRSCPRRQPPSLKPWRNAAANGSNVSAVASAKKPDYRHR